MRYSAGKGTYYKSLKAKFNLKNFSKGRQKDKTGSTKCSLTFTLVLTYTHHAYRQTHLLLIITEYFLN